MYPLSGSEQEKGRWKTIDNQSECKVPKRKSNVEEQNSKFHQLTAIDPDSIL